MPTPDRSFSRDLRQGKVRFRRDLKFRIVYIKVINNVCKLRRHKIGITSSNNAIAIFKIQTYL